MEENLELRIKEDMKAAMKSGDKERLSVIRLILSAIKQVQVDERRELSNADVCGLLNKMIKQRRESVTQFLAGNRKDLADKETYEIEVISTYLPPPLGEQEIDSLIESAISEIQAKTPREMGLVMARLKDLLQGRADVSKVSEKVKARLSH